MKIDDIDKIIERYAEERKHATRQVTQQHFLAHAYLLCTHGEIEPFLKRTRGLLRYYVDCLSLFENPFRNSQVCWLLLLFLVFCFSIFMMTDSSLCLLGMIICTGTVIFGTSLWKIVWSQWLATGILISCYQEIIDLIDSLPSTPVSDSAA
jgi:hypothetical protein